MENNCQFPISLLCVFHLIETNMRTMNQINTILILIHSPFPFPLLPALLVALLDLLGGILAHRIVPLMTQRKFNTTQKLVYLHTDILLINCRTLVFTHSGRKVCCPQMSLSTHVRHLLEERVIFT